MRKLKFPNQKQFAFTIFDDTDNATVDNVKPLYDLLLQLGIITTKSVWVFPGKDTHNKTKQPHTLSNPQYLEFVRWLYNNGFEIALHNASMQSSVREVTKSAIEYFRETLGFYPNVHTNHHCNKENLYWGRERINLPILRFFMKLKKQFSDSEGRKPDSPFFWGDICKNHITYVRNFIFKEINLLRINPTLPYRDPNRRFVNYWFSSSDGFNIENFNQLISSKNQDILEDEGGVCIAYTHFGMYFVEGGKVHPKTKELLHELSMRDGWFVPVSTLLDYLRTQQSSETRSLLERFNMEFRWFLTKVFHGTS